MATFRRISIDQARAEIDAVKPVILDVRDARAFGRARIDGAVNLNNDSVEALLADTPRSQALLVYCYHGNSSLNAARFLVEQGFENVMSIEGGFEAWRKRYPIDTGGR